MLLNILSGRGGGETMQNTFNALNGVIYSFNDTYAYNIFKLTFLGVRPLHTCQCSCHHFSSVVMRHYNRPFNASIKPTDNSLGSLQSILIT